MKRLLLLLSFVFAGAFVFMNARAQTADSLLAKKFIALNASGKFNDVRSMFAPALQGQVSAQMLENVWNGLAKMYGAYRGISGMTYLSQDSFTVVLPECNFDQAEITFSLAFGASHLLYGFRVAGVKKKTDAAPATIPNTHSADTAVEVNGGRIYGTLLMPDKPEKVPVALIIAGSGATDRNGNSGMMLQGNTYRMLADSLAVHGIASFRYDKRLVGESNGFKETEKDLRFDDYVNDAIALVHFLRASQKFSSVIIIGHSEGSLIGMLAAEKTKPDAFISLAGAGEDIGKILYGQITSQPGVDQVRLKEILDSIREGEPVHDVPPYLMTIARPSVQPYMTSWMKYDPATEIKKLTMPVLIINGTTDIQVEEKQAELLHQARPAARLVIIPGMNHILKNAPEDRAENIATYQNSHLPLNASLIRAVISFIQSAPSRNHS